MPTDRTVTPPELTALILAAGEGRRLGGVAKAFLATDGHTLLQRAVLALAPFVARAIVAVRPEMLAKARADAAACGTGCEVECITGGDTRQDSLGRLLDRATSPYVLIHDAARPWIERADVENLLIKLHEQTAVVLHTPIPVRDGLALARDGMIVSPLSRRDVVALQTPHGYARSVLQHAYAEARAHGWQEESTASLVMRAGGTIHLVEGSPANVKITYSDDLELLGPILPQSAQHLEQIG